LTADHHDVTHHHDANQHQDRSHSLPYQNPFGLRIGEDEKGNKGPHKNLNAEKERGKSPREKAQDGMVRFFCGNQHHDQVFGDFLGTGKPQLAFWNQQAKTLYLPKSREIPARLDRGR
jgi:hypothetical protein